MDNARMFQKLLTPPMAWPARIWRLMTVTVLGFASGLPLALTGQALQAWMSVEGLDLATIGFLSLVGLPYTFKFLWAPLVDRFDLPLLSRVVRQFAASAVMAAALWYLLRATMPLYSGSVAEKASGIMLLVAAGLVVYAAVAWVIGAVDKEDIAILARRRSAKPIDEEIPGF